MIQPEYRNKTSQFHEFDLIEINLNKGSTCSELNQCRTTFLINLALYSPEVEILGTCSALKTRHVGFFQIFRYFDYNLVLGRIAIVK